MLLQHWELVTHKLLLARHLQESAGLKTIQKQILREFDDPPGSRLYCFRRQ